MKQITLFSILFLYFSLSIKAQTNVGINTTTPHASAALDVQSTTQGMLVPRMDSTQRATIASPATGLLVYQTDGTTPGFYFFNGTVWTNLGATGPQGPQGIQGLQGIQGNNGATGAQGTAGTNGTNGLKSLVKTTAETAGANCANGGTKVEIGIDTDNDGTLQASEVTATQFVCNGTNGTNGTNGQGVPTGGTANQVLAKVDATDYNTQWVTPSGSSTYPNVELRVTKTVAQTLVATDITQAQTTRGDSIVYSATNHANATLTGGNTWDGTTFTVGSTGAGWYQLTSQLMTNNTISNTANSIMSMLIEINASSASSIYGTNTYSLGNVAMPGFHIRSVATGVVYLSAGDIVKIRAKGSTTTAVLAPRTDGSTYFSVVRLK